MAIQMKKASRRQAKFKLAIAGIAGSGKTMGALLTAYGMEEELHPDWTPEQRWERICIVDTENASGSLYVGAHVPKTTLTIGEYFSIDIEPPFTVDKYIEAIHTAEENGIEVLIIDSISHAWAGEGGALDKHTQIANTSRSGNSYTAWAVPKKDQAQLMNTILQAPLHIICCIRAKTEYVQEKNDNTGRTEVRKIGLGLITQGETEYEYTTVLMLNDSHVATTSKDRTGKFDGQFFTITDQTGRTIVQWLNEGGVPAHEEAESKPEVKKADPVEAAEVNEERNEKAKAAIAEQIEALKAKGVAKAEISQLVKDVAGVANYTKLTSIDTLTEIYKKLKEKVN